MLDLDSLREIGFKADSEEINEMDDDDLSELEDMVDNWMNQLVTVGRLIRAELDLRGAE